MSTSSVFGKTWSLPLGRWAYKVPVYLHVLAIFIVITYFPIAQSIVRTDGFQGVVYSTLLALGLTSIFYLFIYLHELGHAIAALRCQIPVPMIMLHPMGGYAVMGIAYRSPNQEIVVAAAGPLVNGILAAIFALASQLNLLEPMHSIPGWYYIHLLLYHCMWLNLFVLVNLLPIFPLDGAHILRAFLSFSGNPNRATYRTANIGFFFLALITAGMVYLLYTGVDMLGFFGFFLIITCFFSCLTERIRSQNSEIYDSSAVSYGTSAPWSTSSYGEGYSSSTYEEAKAPGFWEKRKLKKAEEAESQKKETEQEMRKQLDDILMKIKREGMDSLTRTEKKMLQQASEHFKDKGGTRP